MPTTKTKTKKYNTTEVNVKRIDQKLDTQTFNAICGVRHLTPASEAEMENLLVSGSAIVPSRDETIEINSPGYEPPMPVLIMPAEATDTEPHADDESPPASAYEYD